MRATSPRGFSYSGTELEAVAEATNYYDWIIGSFAGRIGERAVEAGAGIGLTMRNSRGCASCDMGE